MGRKSNRSNQYQHLFAEQPYSNEMMAEFSEAQGLIENYKPEDRELLLELRDELKKEFWRLARENLTARQYQVIQLLSKGYTQIEIAKQLNVNQSSITKSVHGNCDYRNGRRIYGGTQRKLCRFASTDEKIQEILRKINEVYSNYD